jgi:hypothetical protein
VDGSSAKETSSRRSCREGNRPQPLEVASLLKLAATNVLFPVTAVCGTAVGCVRVSLSQRRLSSPHRWSFASTLLAFQSQPAMHFLQTIGILAVPLIAGRRNVLTVTALPLGQFARRKPGSYIGRDTAMKGAVPRTFLFATDEHGFSRIIAG